MGRKVWVLETSTKGTGANVVPLERVLQSPSSSSSSSSTPTSLYVPPKPPARQAPAPEAEPRAPRRFKVVDLLSREVLGEDVSGRETAEVLRGVRSVVDVNVYVWEPGHERWRLLTVAEQGALWELSKLQDHGAAQPRS
ncbi:MAG TPA: hypothetical protein VG186_12565 [Solirubrobacteraceae bacterium]|jgi:hypothetical protein|nr:hypothetical protein [Solirubrobacteraceae bacterium]